jgi:hypothetical protein
LIFSEKRERFEPPTFLKKISDSEVYEGMKAKFTACATGTPVPTVEWFKNGSKLVPSDRIITEEDPNGLLRLIIEGVHQEDVGKYTCKISNPHGEDTCHADLYYESRLIDRFDLIRFKIISVLSALDRDRRASDVFSGRDKLAGLPVPIAERPYILNMSDRRCTLAWKPSLPSGPRYPVTYQV